MFPEANRPKELFSIFLNKQSNTTV